MDLSTTYLGFDLPHPLMPGASPLVDDLDSVRKLEDADDIVGVQMPLGSAPLRDEQIALIRTWIAEGAQRN